MANADKFRVDCVQFWFFAFILKQRFSAFARAKSQNAIFSFFKFQENSKEMHYLLVDVLARFARNIISTLSTRKHEPYQITSLINAIYIYLFFENRVGKNKDSFYYLAIKNNKIRPKADWKRISDAGH